jgi:hypothetical protein
MDFFFYIHFGIADGGASKCNSLSGNSVTLSPYFQTHLQQNKQYNL